MRQAALTFLFVFGASAAACADGVRDIQSAIAQQDQGHAQLGIVLYSSAIKDPKLSDADRLVAYYNRADAYQLEGDYDSAITDFGQVLRLNPANAYAWYGRGDAYWAMGQRDKALSDYDETLRLDPGAAWAWCARANVHRAKSEYELAMRDYDAALRLSPEDPWIWYSRATAYRDTGDNARAIADYGQALRYDPRYVSAWFARAQVERSAGALDRALADYGEVLRLSPKNAAAWYNRANLHAELGAAEQAVADYNQALSLSPQDAWAYYNRARLQAQLGRYEAAAADYRQALAHNPQNADALFGLGTAQYLSGRYAEAIDSLGKALAAPSDAMLTLGAPGAIADASAEARYRLIWRYLARRRAGQDGTAELRQADAANQGRGWPAPVVDYLLGSISAEQLLASAATQADSASRSCEAEAYIGEAQLLGQQREAALKQLRQAHDHCPHGFVEYALAAAELDRQPAAHPP